MIKDTFASRLQKAMDLNGIKQSQLVEKTKIDKSSISNYLSGNYKANQENLSILAEVLGVNEVWLMGYDVPMKNQPTNQGNNTFNRTQALFDKTKDILSDDDRATIEFIMQKTINNYEKNKNQSNDEV